MGADVASPLCAATLNYIPAGASAGPTSVEIRDGRAADLPGWETCGFELRSHRSQVDDWDDEDQIVERHYAEIRELATALSGCDAAVVTGHIKRNPERAAQHGDLAPITFVHSDFADDYGPQVLERYQRLQGDEAAALVRSGVDGPTAASARRLLILQFWRNIGPPRMDMPLAFCDARTVPRSQVQPIPVNDYAGSGIDFHALGVLAPSEPASHRWYSFEALTADEVVCFRTYDSDRVPTGEPYWTPHSAFRDPSVELGKPARSSIELRASCLFF